jgi:hypothetical protein
MAIDWNALGTAIGAASVMIGGAYTWWLNTKKKEATTRADVAEANSDRVKADAEGAVYTLLTDRLKRLENEITAMRAELVSERQHIRRLTMHIWTLEGLMRKAGLEPPPFIDAGDNAPVAAGADS